MEINEGSMQRDDPQEGLQGAEANDRAARQFNELMENSAAVQDVMMDDVVEEMETEGVDSTGTSL